MASSGIHPTALISSEAEIGDGVAIGPYSIVEGNTQIGAGTTIGSHCHLGVPSLLAASCTLSIGSDSTIRSHSVFYQGSTFGDNLTTGHHTTVRENTNAGVNLQVGSYSDIQGSCDIGDFVRLHSNVFVSQGTRIGDFVWLFPHVVITDDPHPPSESLTGCVINNYAAIGAKAVLMPETHVGEGALVAAAARAQGVVPADQICIGNPGKIIGPTSKIKLRGTSEPAYPWRRHFHRGYPDHIVAEWKKEFDTC